jgi:Ulp1 family protease
MKAADIFQSNRAAEEMSSLYIRTRKQDNVLFYFDYNKIFIVDNERNYHWTFFCIFMGSKTIAFYDSLNGKPKSGKSCDGLLKMLEELARIEQRNFDFKDWNCVQAICTQQVC